MNTFDLSLDLNKGRNVNPVRIRQGDRSGTTIRALVFDHGAAADLSGLTARWVMRLPDGTEYYRKEATVDADGGTVTVLVDETQAASVTGRARGYFQLLQGSTVIASTGDVLVEVLPDALEGAEVAESYDSAIQQAIDNLDAAVDNLPATVEDVLADHPEWVTTVEDGSVTDAKLVQTGGVLSRVERLMCRLDNMLTATTDEGDWATASDAAKTPMAGLSLYGESTQDGTPTPDSPVAIESVRGNLLQNNTASGTVSGVTFTVGEDGAIAISGTATTQANRDIGRGITTLPAGTYTCGEGEGTGYSITMFKVVNGTASVIRNGFGTFTLDAETSVFMRIVINSGAVLNGVVRPCIYAGTTPCPYVPYGHAGLWARGRNLLSLGEGTSTSKGITFTFSADGSIAISGTSTGEIGANSTYTSLPAGTYTLSADTSDLKWVNVYDSDSNGLGHTVNGVLTFTLAEPKRVRIYPIVASGKTIDTTIWPMLEVGTVAHDWEPHAESVTPIDLQGHELRSLPDGTRDEVTVDERGHAVLTQRVGSAHLDSFDNTSTASDVVIATRLLRDGVLDATPTDVTCICDKLETYQATNTSFIQRTNVIKVSRASTSNTTMRLFALFDGTETTLAEHNARLAEIGGITVLYPLATPVTIDLGYVDPIALQGPDMTAQAIPQAPFALTYERDLNVTLARLEAAIAALV